jgi:hypothetical protein
MEYQTRPYRVRFGVFEVDLDAGELFKNGIKLRISEQPFQLLTVLLERQEKSSPARNFSGGSGPKTRMSSSTGA